MTVLEISEKLERLVSRLPHPLRKPILREITPVKDLFLRRRPPRLMLLGCPGVAQSDLINALFDGEQAQASIAEAEAGYWESHSREGQGTLKLLDARSCAGLNRIKSGPECELPDLVLFLKGEAEEISPEVGGHAEKVIEFMASRQETHVPLIGVVLIERPGEDSMEIVRGLRLALRTLPALKPTLIETIALVPGTVLGEGIQGNAHPLAEAVALALPDDAKLEMARLSGVKSALVHIAQPLIRSFTAITGAIGAQPIPLADFPILTSLQATMVAGIMLVSGREMTAKLGGEFMAALGANIGVGLVFREGSRALLKLLPGWGNAISGAIASAGTYAVGRSATAYFIEGASLAEARRLFRRSKKSAIDKKRLGR